MAKQEIWIRLGVFIETDRENISKILKGDEQTLRNAVDNGEFRLEGESYIPAESIEDYNETYNEDAEEVVIDFYL